MVPIGVLASGRGSNLDAVLDAVENHYLTKCEVKIVISNRPNAPALEVAKKHHVETITLDDKGVPKKNWDYDQRTVGALQSRGVAPKTGLIVLAGYLRILSEQFVDLYTRRIINVHPALLPSFPGLEAQKQALDHGVKVTGCTVHFVDREVDHGPVILQTPVAIRDDDTAESLSDRILREEHRILPEAIRLLTEDQLKLEGRRVLFKN
ncbi:phosphoribosylglycinamide formyltransferase [Candidatus Bathyarchaeota archaeon]|nr:MAG: phosphoribosylglycinamide formyltransferase [Candidatus Bathyarchaeota archaeon]TMI60528.1 MAG: phosphoribosylglycinamide formyltransferase [Candidatus Bathyarchaeota archaeon]